MPREIRRLADSILREPVFVEVAPVSSTADSIAQSVYLVARKDKPVLLERLLRQQAMERTLIFTRTKHGADKLVKILKRSGIESGAIHGNKTQNVRTRTMQAFKSGRMPVLIATDIASRGIDVDEITHVVNFDLPNEPETYVHRIGRTARAGASGIAFSFCDYEELGDLRAIEKLIGNPLEVCLNETDLVYEAPAKTPRRSGNRYSGKSNQGSSRRGGGRSRSGGTPHSARNGSNGRSRVKGSKSGHASRKRSGRAA
jgi:ATP-dependent RNA helicase RhlE